MPDWHAAVLNFMGDSIRIAMMNPGIAMFFAFVGLLFSLQRRLVRSQWAALIGVFLVICAGGQGGVNLFSKFGWKTAVSNYDPIQDDVGAKGQVFWFAFLPHVFLPQRGAAFAYPLVLTIFLMVWEGTTKSKEMEIKTRRALLFFAGILAGTLPLVQAHSYIGVALVIGLIFLLESPTWLANPTHLQGWIPAGIGALVISVPQLMTFAHTALEGGPNGTGTFMDFRPIWKPPAFHYPADIKNFFWFWYRSIGEWRKTLYLFTCYSLRVVVFGGP